MGFPAPLLPRLAAAAMLPPPGAPNTLHVIDLSSFLFRAYYAAEPQMSSKGEPTHAIRGTLAILHKIFRTRRPSHVVVVMDTRGPTFRHALDRRYKAHRPPCPPDLGPQIVRCEEILRAYPLTVCKQEGFEADDVIATLVEQGVAEGVRVVILSADKDLMQLIHDDNDQVLMWDSMRNRVYGAAEVLAKFGVPPSQMRDLLALMGDTADNIPGARGVGPKTAASLMETFGSIDGLYANLHAVKSCRIREILLTCEAEVRLSRELVTLRSDTDIGCTLPMCTFGAMNYTAVQSLFAELEIDDGTLSFFLKSA